MDEKVLVVCRKHWLIIGGIGVVGAACLIVGFIGMVFGAKNFGIAVLIALLGIEILIRAWLYYRCHYIILTDKRLVARRGILFPYKWVRPRNHIRLIKRKYTLSGAILGYRTIEVYFWGEDKPEISFNYMTKSKELWEAVNKIQLNNVK